MTVKIMARLTLMNHRLSVHPARLFRILRLESVPDVEEDLENTASALPHKYCKKKWTILKSWDEINSKTTNCLVSGHDYDGNGSIWFLGHVTQATFSLQLLVGKPQSR